MDGSESQMVLGAQITFAARPFPLPADLRAEWRIALLLCVLMVNCRSGRSSLRRLQVINWAARSAEARVRFLQVIDHGAAPDDVIIRVEPGLNRAIDFAAAEDLVSRPGGNRVQLTERGREMVRQIQAVADCLTEERSFLASLGMRLTEQRAKELLERG